MVQLFEFEAAAEHYRYAFDKFSENGFDLYAVDCRNGLAWLRMLKGDYHVALKELAECEEGYQRIKQPRGVVLCQLDRAEAFLALNLFDDAEKTARAARTGARQLGIAYETAKADFFLAQALYGTGRVGQSKKALDAADSGFTEARNGGFRAAVELFRARFDTRQSRSDRIETARRRFSQAQLPLWEAICDVQRLSSDPDNQKALRRLNRNAAARTVPHLIAEKQTLLGDRAARRGRKQDAVEYWRQAADVLDAVRAKLPPLELRDAFSQNRRSPHLNLVRSELPDRPDQAAAWSERYRTAGIWAASDTLLRADHERSRAEQSLAALAQQVTNLAGRLDPSGQRTGPPAVSRQLNQLQRSVRDRLAVLESHPGSEFDAPDELAKRFRTCSQRLPIVQFHRDGNDLHAFVHRRGDTQWVQYSGGAEELAALIARWRFLVSLRSHAGSSVGKRDIEDERQLLTRLGQWLWKPLGIPERTRKVLLLPEGDLYNLPWGALQTDGRPLAERHRFILAPSLRHYHHARETRVRSRHGDVFIGRTDGLTHLGSELDRLLENPDIDVHRRCRRDDVPDAGVARLWHFTGHATLRADNPFYSALEMVDGPLFAADFRLRKVKLDLALLAGCRTGQQVSLPGEETTGLVRSLLEMGARNVIASGWAIADHPTAFWTGRFYEHYLAGCDLTETVGRAAMETREKFPSAYHWAAFSLYGAG
jgi:tetratricopeptide (TPR) repeat protein